MRYKFILHSGNNVFVSAATTTKAIHLLYEQKLITTDDKIKSIWRNNKKVIDFNE